MIAETVVLIDSGFLAYYQEINVFFYCGGGYNPFQYNDKSTGQTCTRLFQKSFHIVDFFFQVR